MKPRSTLSGPVHRIAFGTAVLLGIGSILTLAASEQSGRASASPNDVSVSSVAYGETTDPQDDANGGVQETTTAYSSGVNTPEGGAGGSGVYCCVSSGGNCGMFAGSGCPSGTTPTACPCSQPV